MKLGKTICPRLSTLGEFGGKSANTESFVMQDRLEASRMLWFGEMVLTALGLKLRGTSMKLGETATQEIFELGEFLIEKDFDLAFLLRSNGPGMRIMPLELLSDLLPDEFDRALSRRMRLGGSVESELWETRQRLDPDECNTIWTPTNHIVAKIEEGLSVQYYDRAWRRPTKVQGLKPKASP